MNNIDAPYLFVMLSEPSPKMQAWFWDMVMAAGIHKGDCRLVYIIDEAPQGANGKPTKAQLRAACDRYEAEVNESNPKVVVAMGGDALLTLTGIRQTIFDARGYIINDDLHRNVTKEVMVQVGVYKAASRTTGAVKGDPKMKRQNQAGAALLTGRNIPVIPSFTLDHVRVEGFALAPVFKEDLKRAARVANGTVRPVDANFRYCRTLADVLSTPFPRPGAFVAVDIETHGIDNEVIDLVSFSDGETSASLEWSLDVMNYMSDLFAMPGVHFALHNSPFDLPRLIANGVAISQEVIERRVFDTMFGAVVIQPDLHKSLGRVASLYLDCSPWKWRDISSADPRLYSAKDAYMTSLLARQQSEVMKAIGCWNMFTGDGNHPGPGEMATIPVLTEMSRLGIPINTDYVQKWLPQLERRLLRLITLWDKHFPETKWSSSKSLQRLFYGEWGLPYQKTREGGVSTDELACVTLRAYVEEQRRHPSVGSEADWRSDPRCNARTFDLLLALRDVDKTMRTYVLPVALEAKRRVHPQYLPVSKDSESGANNQMTSKGNTATGRLSATNPNIQNQPKKTRVLFVPDSADHCFIQADYKSAELYVMAWMAGDKKLLADLSGDMHQLNADRLGISRKTAKNVTYASQYLAGPSKQSEMILKQTDDHIYVPPAECLRVANGIWGHYDKVKAYREYLIATCKIKKYIRNPFGRIRFFHKNEAPAAVNFIPQSVVADVLWCVLKPVSDMAKSFGGRIYTTVHDSIVIAVPKENAAQAARRIKEVMEQKFDIVAPGFYIPVEVEMAGPGEPWSAIKPLK